VEAVNVMPSSTAPFTIHNSFAVNPVNASLFPWLGTVANNFQEYKMNGLMFVFVSECPDAIASATSLGYVGWVAEYDPYAAPPTSKNDALNRFWSGMCKPSKSYTAFVECARSSRPTDVLLTWESPSGHIGPAADYNLANYYCFGGGQPTDAGELGQVYVVYDITLMKPRLPEGSVIPPSVPIMLGAQSVCDVRDPETGVYNYIHDPTTLYAFGGASVDFAGTLSIPQGSVDKYYLVNWKVNWGEGVGPIALFTVADPVVTGCSLVTGMIAYAGPDESTPYPANTSCDQYASRSTYSYACNANSYLSTYLVPAGGGVAIIGTPAFILSPDDGHFVPTCGVQVMQLAGAPTPSLSVVPPTTAKRSTPREQSALDKGPAPAHMPTPSTAERSNAAEAIFRLIGDAVARGDEYVRV